MRRTYTGWRATPASFAVGIAKRGVKHVAIWDFASYSELVIHQRVALIQRGWTLRTASVLTSSVAALDDASLVLPIWRPGPGFLVIEAFRATACILPWFGPLLVVLWVCLLASLVRHVKIGYGRIDLPSDLSRLTAVYFLTFYLTLLPAQHAARPFVEQAVRRQAPTRNQDAMIGFLGRSFRPGLQRFDKSYFTAPDPYPGLETCTDGSLHIGNRTREAGYWY